MRDLAVIQATESFVILQRNKEFDREKYLGRLMQSSGTEYLTRYLGHNQADHMSPAAWRVLDTILQRGSL